MPELPEVEVVRRGIAPWVIGAHIADAEVAHPRPLRCHEGGPQDFVAQLTGRHVLDVVRRGKFLWLHLDNSTALVIHLGMSGQLRIHQADGHVRRHVRARLLLRPDAVGVGQSPVWLAFVDQRMFGSLRVSELVPTIDGLPGGCGGLPAGSRGLAGERSEAAPYPLVPLPVAHIARDILDPHLNETAVSRRIRSSNSAIKRVLLNQNIISGIGNIYADEGLWHAKIHYDTMASSLSAQRIRLLLNSIRTVMRGALEVGGTSFDRLYVNVEGRSGYFAQSLMAYGRDGTPCQRCGTTMVREAFTNRSSFFCPRCQRRR